MLKLIIPHWYWSKSQKDNQTESNEETNTESDETISRDNESISDDEFNEDILEEEIPKPVQKPKKEISEKVRQNAKKKNITIV